MHRVQETGRERLALRSGAAWLLFLLIIIAGSAADLWSKAWAQHHFEKAGRYGQAHSSSIPLVDFVWQANHGAVFGLGQNKVVFFIVFTLLAIVALGWLFAKSHRRNYLLHIALALVTAGAMGNLYDRINFGFVRDFLRFNVTASWASWGGEEGFLWPYVFNVADVWISVGVASLAILWLWGMPVCGCKTDADNEATDKTKGADAKDAKRRNGAQRRSATTSQSD